MNEINVKKLCLRIICIWIVAAFVFTVTPLLWKSIAGDTSVKKEETDSKKSKFDHDEEPFQIFRVIEK